MVVSSDSERFTYIGQPHRIKNESDPLKVQGVILRITSCSFPQPGLYWVEFRYNDEVLARQPLLVE